MLGFQLSVVPWSSSSRTLLKSHSVRKSKLVAQRAEQWRNGPQKAKLSKRSFCSHVGSDSIASTRTSRAPLDSSHAGSGSVQEAVRNGNRSNKFNWSAVDDSNRPHGTFKVSSYNILADSYGEPGPGRVSVPKPYVQGRMSLILRDIELLGSDIVCLQEVESGLVEAQLRPFFQSRGYEYEYCVKSRAKDPLTPDNWKPRIDGLLIAWRSAKFSKLSVSNFELRQLLFEHPTKWGVERKTMQSLLKLDTPISIIMLETTHVKAAKKVLCLANIHGYAGGEHAKPLINVIQTQLAVHAARKVMYQHLGMNPKKVEEDAPSPIPFIFAGDFNARPGSGTYQLLSSGFLPRDSTWLTYLPGKQSTNIDMKHHLNLASAYGQSPMGEPELTHHASATLRGTIDYIWYTPANLHVHRLLDLPDFTQRQGLRLPTVEFPSDHLPVGAEFSFNPTSKKQPTTEDTPIYVTTEYNPTGTGEKPKILTPEKPKREVLHDDEEEEIDGTPFKSGKPKPKIAKKRKEKR